MYSGNAKRQILISLSTRTRYKETSVSDHIRKLLLTGELLDALDKILVAVSIGGNDLADQRDSREAPPLVEGIEWPVLHLAELQTCEYSTGSEDAVCFAQGDVLAGEVSDAKGNGIEIDGVVLDHG